MIANAHDGGTVNGDISWITNFIWGIADDVLRDLYVRGKYRDVILPMVVLRRLDAVLEPTSADVVEMTRTLDEQGVVNQDGALRLAAGQSLLQHLRVHDARPAGAHEPAAVAC